MEAAYSLLLHIQLLKSLMLIGANTTLESKK